MGEIIIKKEINEELNIKKIFIKMDEIITMSLNEGNIHFFITINFQKEIKQIKDLNKKIILLENKIKEIELISWYNIISEKNEKNNYHIHIILAIKSIIGYNNNLANNIKYFLINNLEIDTKLDICWDFINIKKSWRYLYKDYIKTEEKIKTKISKKKKKIEKNTLDPIFECENVIENIVEEKNNNKLKYKIKNKINILKVEKNQEKWFENIKKELKVETFDDNVLGGIKGIKLEEKNYNEKQLYFLWDFFLFFNDMVIYKEKLYLKISDSMVSFKLFNKIDFLFENMHEIFFFYKKNFPFQFENFDELNFNVKFLKNKKEKLERLIEFSGKKVNFNFNILEFKDGIYSILYNKFIRTNRFEKNHKINLKKILLEKEIFTIKHYECSYEHLKKPELWLKSVEKVLGLKKRENTLSDKIAKFFKEDDIEWLLVYIAYVFHYSSNELNKKNTLYIWGPSNTGKTTLITNVFINFFGKENIGLISNNKNFEYQHLMDKNLIIFDEFDVEKINIENFKKLVSKELILGEKKGKNPELINPTPMMILSNYNLEYKLNMSDNKESVINRFKIINFKERFKENEMDESINKKIKEEEARIVTYCNEIYFYWLKKKNDKKKTRMDDMKLLEKI